MAKHLPTGLAEAGLFSHIEHRKQRDWKRRMEEAEPIAIEQLTAEGLVLTVRNIVTRQWAIAEKLASDAQ